MSNVPLEYLRHILDETAYLIQQRSRFSLTQFLKDPTAQRAFVRSLEIIGEAVKKLPEDIRIKYPEVRWKAIAGMRDKMIHHYFGVDYELVWDVVDNKIPLLDEQIKGILDQE